MSVAKAELEAKSAVDAVLVCNLISANFSIRLADVEAQLCLARPGTRGHGCHFPLTDVCLDWIHVTEKLWTAGQCIFAEGSADLVPWVAERLALLRSGWVARMPQNLNAAYLGIARTGPGNKGHRERIGDVVDYLTVHRSPLGCHPLRGDDLPIGTWVIEGSIRNLIRVRLDGPGMR